MFKLSPQQFAEVLASLQTAVDFGGREKRESTRMNVEAPVKIGMLGDDRIIRCFAAISRDISMTGIGLCQGTAFKSQERFLICVGLAKHQFVLKCMTTFCRRLADGVFMVGARFEAEADSTISREFQVASTLRAA